MKQTLSISLSHLEQIIEELRAELLRYAGRENAKPAFVEKQNRLIADLCTIHNDLDCLDMFELWSDIEQKMKDLEKLDPQIDSHCIVIQIKPGRPNILHSLTLNPATHDRLYSCTNQAPERGAIKHPGLSNTG